MLNIDPLKEGEKYEDLDSNVIERRAVAYN